MLPLYLEKLNPNDLKERSEKLHELQRQCRLCPNECMSERERGKTGLCHSNDKVTVSAFSPHFGEEPPLVGSMGSGTIFFTNCNLSCVYCQNYDISQLSAGKEIGSTELAEIMMKLQNRGCHNINLVTPTHFVPQIIDALILAVVKGLEVPIVYNCGGFESLETLKLLEDIIDIYMPDFKYSNNEIGKEYSGINNHWDICKAAIFEMHRQVGDLKVSRRGLAQRGVLIRHLVLPNKIAGSFEILDFIAANISGNSYVNIMDQYHPAYRAGKFSTINRTVNSNEYSKVLCYAKKLGLTRGLEI